VGQARSSKKKGKAKIEPHETSVAEFIRGGLIGKKRRAGADGLVFADDLLILEGDGAESGEEFSKLHQALRRDLWPRGTLEEMLVESVASCIWRKKRLLRFERGKTEQAQIRARLEFFESKHRGWEFKREMEGDDLSMRDCMRYPEGIDHVIRLLDRMQAEIESKGHLSQEVMTQVWQTWCRDESAAPRVGFWVYFFNSQLSGEHPMEEELDEQRCRKGLLGILDAERERLEAVRELVIEELEARAEAHIDSLSIPNTDTIKRMEEYRTSVDREMYLALDQFERLQRARLGDVVYTIMRLAATADEVEPELVQKVGELKLSITTGAGTGVRPLRALRLK
jgi:hypothetical protein